MRLPAGKEQRAYLKACCLSSKKPMSGLHSMAEKICDSPADSRGFTDSSSRKIGEEWIFFPGKMEKRLAIGGKNIVHREASSH